MFDPLGPIYYGEVKPKPNQKLHVNKPDPIKDYEQQGIFSQSNHPASINESSLKIPAETFSYSAVMNSLDLPVLLIPMVLLLSLLLTNQNSVRLTARKYSAYQQT